MPTLDRDHVVLVSQAADDRDRAGLDDEEVIAVVTLTEQHLARIDLAQAPDRE
jgi:hypothetical protein